MYQFAEQHDLSLSLFHAHAPAKRETEFSEMACYLRIDKSRMLVRGIPSIDLRKGSDASPGGFFIIRYINHTHTKTCQLNF
jgi:hypothetical protein